MTFYTAREIREIFDSFDVNHSGIVEYEEFMVGFRLLFPRFHRETIEKLYRKADKDFSRKIEFAEFQNLIRDIERKQYSYDPFIKMFDEHDKDGNGILDVVEFVHIWKTIDPTLEAALITELFTLADIDKNGSIDFNEYLNIIANVKAQIV